MKSLAVFYIVKKLPLHPNIPSTMGSMIDNNVSEKKKKRITLYMYNVILELDA